MFIEWSKIPSEIIDEWVKKHLECDFEYLGEYFPSDFPLSVSQKVLESPNLWRSIKDPFEFMDDPVVLGAAFSAVDHARFAEIARQRPDLAKVALELPFSEISSDIFSSCVKEEMKVFLPQLGGIYVASKPLIVINISSALPDDEHFCKDRDIEEYKSMTWLYQYASPRCMSLITVPNGKDAEEFLDELRVLHSGVVDDV
jgi:hypothetical protein